jgi:hypothetical protein
LFTFGRDGPIARFRPVRGAQACRPAAPQVADETPRPVTPRLAAFAALTTFRLPGLHACVDHRAGDFAAQLAAACPTGLDVYFENVGGGVQQTAWPLLNDFARICLCA